MATKTISLDIEAYECLRKARLDARESFSKVVKRAVWPAKSGSAAALLAWRNESPDLPDETTLDALDRIQEIDEIPEDKWKS